MGSFHLAGMSLKNLFSKPATKMYPVVKPEWFERTKGRVENDIAACILCGICQKKCPAAAIVVDKPAGTWTLNPFSCVQCYSCIRACPKNSLSMDAQYTACATAQSTKTLSKHAE
jgi:ech hydrogenase subunit F